MDFTLTHEPTVLTPGAIADRPSEPLGTLRGASHQLWRNETSMARVLTVEAGHRLGTHSHRLYHHHIWVLDGNAKILDQNLGPGAYAHIPSGVTHDIDATASYGCTVYYLYIRPSGSATGTEGI